MKSAGLVVSCEHGGRRVPTPHAPRFAAHGALLRTHRGWDPGALRLARELAEALDAPLVASTTTRLLVDLNRSIGHPHLFSEITRHLPRAERLGIVARHYRPHRLAIEGEVARRVEAGQQVTHIASHSFTPVFDGLERAVDVAWLYDPRRPAEAALARRWMSALAALAPDLRLRRNHPYRGRSDGLTSLLRKRFSDEVYVGLELEVNQAFVAQGGPRWSTLRADLIASLQTALNPTPHRSTP